MSTLDPQADPNYPVVVDGLEEKLPEWQVDHVYCWDDTAQQVCPADPRVVEDLQRQGHFILSLTSAFRTKLGLLQNSVNGPLLAKRDALLVQQAKIQSRIDEVKAASSAIEKETKHNAEEIVERLKSTERFKLSLLLRDKVDLAKDVEVIQGLVEEVAHRGQATSMIDFLGKEKHLKDRCDMLIGKPYKVDIEVQADDFEHETKAHKDVVKKYGALQELVEVKDTIIAQLLEDRALLQKKVEMMEESHGKRVTGLEKEKDNLLQALAKLGPIAVEPGEVREEEESRETLSLAESTSKISDKGEEEAAESVVSGSPESRATSNSQGVSLVQKESGSEGGTSNSGKDWLMTIEHNGKRIEVYQEDKDEFG